MDFEKSVNLIPIAQSLLQNVPLWGIIFFFGHLLFKKSKENWKIHHTRLGEIEKTVKDIEIKLSGTLSSIDSKLDSLDMRDDQLENDIRELRALNRPYEPRKY